ncbi:hypothetical protein ACOSP7_013090 [Xanthoceras sorbifolium]
MQANLKLKINVVLAAGTPLPAAIERIQEPLGVDVPNNVERSNIRVSFSIELEKTRPLIGPPSVNKGDFGHLKEIPPRRASGKVAAPLEKDKP